MRSVAENLSIEDNHHITGIWRSLGDVTPEYYHVNVFYKAIDSILAGLSTRYEAVREIANNFQFL